MEIKEKERIIAEVKNIAHEKIILISGEEGSGKTTLLRELCSELSRDYICIYNNALSAPGKEIFSQIIERIKKDVPSLRLGILDAISRKQVDVSNTLISIVSVISSFKVMAMIFDDVENFSKDALDSLYYIITSLRESRVVMIISYNKNLLGREAQQFIIKLNELPEDYVLDMELKGLSRNELKNYLKESGYTIPDYVVDKIMDISDGYPGKVNEILSELKSRGSIDADNYWVGTFEELPRPKSGKYVPVDIMKIVDEKELDFLSYASVYGINFNLEDLIKIKNMKFEEAMEIINSLISKKIIEETGENSFKFLRHEYRDIIYSSMSGIKRRFIHRKIAEYLEKNCDCPETVGNHYYLSGEIERAGKYLKLAAEKRFAEGNYKNSHELLKKYLEIAGDQDINALKLMMDVLVKLGRYGEALKYSEILERKGIRDKSTMIKRAYIFYNLGNYLEAEKILEYMNAEELDDERKFYYFLIKGGIESRRYNFSEGEKFLEKSLEIASSIKDNYLLALAYKEIGNLHYYAGNLENAYKNFVESLKLYEMLKDYEGMARIYNNLSLIDVNKDVNVAIDEYQKSMVYADMAGNAYLSIAIRLNISQLYFWTGKVKEAEKEINVAFQISKLTGEMEMRHSIYSYLSDVHILKGEFEKAIEYIQEAIKISESMGSKFFTLLYKLKKNEIYAMMGREIEIFPEDDDNDVTSIYISLYKSMIMLYQGKFKESANLMQQALEKSKGKITFLDTVIFEGNLPFAYLMAGEREKFLESYRELKKKADDLKIDMIYLHAYYPSIDFIERGENTLEREEMYFNGNGLKFLLLKTYIDGNILKKIGEISSSINFNYTVFVK